MANQEHGDRDLRRDMDRDPLTGKTDTGLEAPGADAGTGAGDGASAPLGVAGGPDLAEAERDQSGLGAESASGRSGWQGSAPSQDEIGGMGRGDTGSLGAGGSTDAQWQQGRTDWQGRTAGEAGDTGGAQGQGTVGGESWEGRDRDTGGGGWTKDDSGHTAGADDEGRSDLS